MANHSYCENCGIPCPLGDTLCASCARQVQTEFSRPEPRRQEPPRSGGSKILIPIFIGILVIILAIVALVMIFKVFHKDDSQTELTTQETIVQSPTGDTEPDTTPPVGAQEEPEEEKPVEAMTACVECGASVPESVRFCPYCGESQTEKPEEEPEETPEPITMARIESADANPNSWGKVGISAAYGTSVISQSGNYDNTAGVTLDGDLSTSWQEGVTGSGVGEGIVYNLDDEYAVQYISFNLGNWRSTTWYAENNVPQALDIVINEEIYRVSFPYGQSKYWVALSEPVVTDCVEIYIAAAYPGSVYNDTCIAEVGIYGEPA